MRVTLVVAGDSRVCVPVLYEQDGLQAQRNAAVVRVLMLESWSQRGPYDEIGNAWCTKRKLKCTAFTSLSCFCLSTRCTRFLRRACSDTAAADVTHSREAGEICSVSAF